MVATKKTIQTFYSLYKVVMDRMEQEATMPLSASDREDHYNVRMYLETGDQKYFNNLYEKYQPRMINFIKGKLWHNQNLAMDVFQEVMMRIFKELHRFNFRYKFSTLIYRICRNYIIDKFIRKKNAALESLNKQVNVEDPDTNTEIQDLIADERMDVVFCFEKDETRKAVFDQAFDIPEKYREVLLLRFYDKLQYQKISKIVGKSMRTVKYRVQDGLMLLRDKLVEKNISLL